MNPAADEAPVRTRSGNGADLAASVPPTDPRVIAALEEYLALLDAGQRPGRDEFLARHPHVTEALAQALNALEFVHGVASGLHGSRARPPGDAGGDLGMPLGTPLGDYRLLREVGRGGMGVVYEAEQISLGRHVALKVLPFAAALDAKGLQRFKNEAQAAACLHHPNIVPVYGVGADRGVHYYAMQFIEGQTLAALIQDLRRLAGLRPEGPGSLRGPVAPVVSELVSGRWAPAERDWRAGSSPTDAGPASASSGATGAGREPAVPAADTCRLSAAALSTAQPTKNPTFFRVVANLAVQAAEALVHAHGVGIVHRDVKPANLLVDGQGTLWVTDFGLAKVQADAKLTLTGDLVGTLRYMSPEQALAQGTGVDHRTDLYSLGATFYELLTLEPAFRGRDRQELLRQIALEEPKPPRRANKAVPVELETIVLKAMAKNPAERYATARELADDLRRFLKDEPILAKRPTLVQRGWKWARRHQPVVWSAAAAALVALVVLAGSAGWAVRDRAGRQAQIATEVRAATAESRQFQKEGKLPQAEAAAKRAEALLPGGGGGEELRRGVRDLRADLRMVAKLEEARLLRTGLKDGRFDLEAEVREYALAFRDYGIDVEALDSREAAERIRARPIRVELAAALDGWAKTRRRIPRKDGKSWQDLLAVARSADPDPWRTALRDAALRGDRPALVERAASDQTRALPPVTLVLLAESLAATGGVQEATALLRRAQEQHPGDFWINHQLAYYVSRTRPPQWDEAIRFYTAAVALRPDSPGARLNLGVALSARGRLDEAIAASRRAIDLKPDYAEAHCNLGLDLIGQGRLDEALAAVRQALALKPQLAEAHCNLGVIHQKEGRLDEAVAANRRAIALKPSHAGYHTNLGSSLADQGQLDEALAACRKAVALNCDYAEAHSVLGLVLQRKGQLDEAVAACRRAIELKPDLPAAHFNLGNALGFKGRYDEAVAAHRRAIDLKPEYAEAHCNLGVALDRKGRLDEAIAAFRRATELKPDLFRAHFNLGIALNKTGRLDEAVAAYRRAIDLKPEYAEPHYDLGNALRDQGRLDEAVAAYRRAIDLKPEYAEAHCNLGTALRQQGEFAQALVALKRGHELGTRRPDWPYASARWVEEYRRLGELQGRLPAVLRGEALPADAAERGAYALLCYDQRRYVAAARLRASVLTADPKLADDLEAGYRYDAACMAALAGCGQGADADQINDQERVRWRKQALEGLQADLEAYGKRLESGKPGDRRLAQQRLQGWQGNWHLTGLRDPAVVARLPAGEQEACMQLWAEVRALLTKADAVE